MKPSMYLLLVVLIQLIMFNNTSTDIQRAVDPLIAASRLTIEKFRPTYVYLHCGLVAVDEVAAPK